VDVRANSPIRGVGWGGVLVLLKVGRCAGIGGQITSHCWLTGDVIVHASYTTVGTGISPQKGTSTVSLQGD
jgi:hypothetical protein